MAACARPCSCALRDDVDARRVRRPTSNASPPAPVAQLASSEVEDIVQQLESAKTGFALAVGPHRIRLTNLDRVYWPADAALKQPALTKRDLLRYFAQVSPFMLPHLADRPLTMIRMPDGITRPAFLPEALERDAAGVRRNRHRLLGAQGRASRLPALQQPAHAALARPVRHARIPRVAFARAAPARTP